MMSKPLAVETPQRIWNVHFNRYNSVKKFFSDLGKEVVLNVISNVFVSIRFPSFLIVKRLQAVTRCLRYSVRFSSVSCLSILSRIITLQLLRVLCSVTVTFKLKNFVIFRRFSDWLFRLVSTKRVPFFIIFFTFFGVPIKDSICFSIIKCNNDVICFSSLLEITKNLGKFSFALKVNVVGCVSSSEDSNARNRFRVAMVINFWFDSYAPHPPWSPTRGRLTEMDLLFLTSRLHCYYTLSRSESSARPNA